MSSQPHEPNDADTIATALRYYQAGEFTRAEQAYREIVNADPDQADALYALGTIAYSRGQFETAVDWFLKAVRGQEANPVLHLNLAAAYQALGQPSAAEGCCRRALQLKPDFAEAYNNLANALLEQGRLDEAVARYEQALLARPRYAEANNNLGIALWKQGKLAAALQQFQQACRSGPGWMEPERNRGLLLEQQGVPGDTSIDPLPQAPPRQDGTATARPARRSPVFDAPAMGNQLKRAAVRLRQGRLDEAIALCREELATDPDRESAYRILGTALAQRREFEEAATAFHNVLRLNPADAEIYCKLGAALREQGKPELAAGYLRQALALDPDLVAAHAQLGMTFTELGPQEAALASYRHALRLKPDAPLVQIYLGSLLEELGHADEGGGLVEQALASAKPKDFRVFAHYAMSLTNQGRDEEARVQFQRVLARQPDFAAAYFGLAQDRGYRFTPGELAHMEDLLARDNLPLRDRINLHFALSRLSDREKDYARAFAHCEQANTGKLQLGALQGNAFSAEAHAALVDRLIAAFDGQYFRRTAGFGKPGCLLVFIIGMPRSGTSLVEQILASHPAVFAAGELRNLNQLVNGLPAALGSAADYPECLDQLDQERAQRMAAEYLQGLPRAPGDKSRLTDKMPMNFHHLGLVATLLPQVALIHCQREARDVCWSCYYQNFRDVHFACDLGILGSYFRQYERLMAHWRNVLPLPILEVSYEGLVEEPERISRQMVNFCGLPWDAACLDFHENRRTVRTASNLQVRQPIYKGSIGKWRNYEPYLGTLLEALSAP